MRVFLLNRHPGGYAYCGTAALAMADRDQSAQAIDKGVTSRQELLKFLAQRQFPYMAEAEAADYDEENLLEASLQDLSLEDGCKHVGYNGRWNKKADTCYCWWAVGTLTVSNPSRQIDPQPKTAAQANYITCTASRPINNGQQDSLPPVPA